MAKLTPDITCGVRYFPVILENEISLFSCFHKGKRYFCRKPKNGWKICAIAQKQMIRCQFHQRFYVRIFHTNVILAAFLVTFWLWRMYESTFVRKIRAFNVDEIDFRSSEDENESWMFRISLWRDDIVIGCPNNSNTIRIFLQSVSSRI